MPNLWLACGSPFTKTTEITQRTKTTNTAQTATNKALRAGLSRNHGNHEHDENYGKQGCKPRAPQTTGRNTRQISALREKLPNLARQNRTIAIASDFRVDGARSPEIPQKKGVWGSEIAIQNRKSLATFHRILKSQCSIALSCLDTITTTATTTTNDYYYYYLLLLLLLEARLGTIESRCREQKSALLISRYP